MNDDDHDARRATGPSERAPHGEPADAPAFDLAMAAAASASASLSVLDIPAIVRRRARPRSRRNEPESSGLVDIADLCFGEGVQRASITPLLPIAADPEPERRVDHERSLLWAATAAAAVAVSAMFAVALAREPAKVIVRTQPHPAPVMSALDEAPALVDEDEPDAPLLDTDDDDAAIVIDDASPEPAPEPSSKPSSSRTRKRASSKPATKASSPPADAPGSRAPAATDAPKGEGELSVACVLDPKSCGLGGGAAPSPSSPLPTPTSLPDKLGTTALRAVLGPAKASAQTCGPRHDAASGTQVQVKLSIAGATGRVQSATALGEHAGTALGRCVAEALSTGVFPRFSAPQQGVVWPVRL